MPNFLDNIGFWTQGYKSENVEISSTSIPIIINKGTEKEEEISLEIPGTTITLPQENPEQKMITDVSRDITKEKEIGVYQITKLTESGMNAITNKIDESLGGLSVNNIIDQITELQEFDNNHNNIENGDGVGSIMQVSTNNINVVTGKHSAALAYKNKVYADASVALGHSNTIGTQGQTDNASQGSVAAGHGNTLTGDASFAANYNNTVSGTYASAFGGNNTANGYASFVAGEENEVTVQRATSFGYKNKVSGVNATAFGAQNTVNSDYSFVSGDNNIASGSHTTLFGQNNEATAWLSFIAGKGNKVSDQMSAAIGYSNNVSGDVAIALGHSNKVTSSSGFAANTGNIVEGINASAFGISNKANGYASFVAGQENEVACQKSAAFGGLNQITDSGYSFASGYDNKIISGDGANSAFGRKSIIKGWGNATFGNTTKATTSDFKLVCGQFNEDIQNALFEVGIGSSENDRRNGITVLKDGTLSAKKIITEDTLVVQGNLDVKGTTTTVNTESLTVNDNLIVTNAQGAATPYTGVVSLTGEGIYKLLPGRYEIRDAIDMDAIDEWWKKNSTYKSHTINVIFNPGLPEPCTYITVVKYSTYIQLYTTVHQGEMYGGSFEVCYYDGSTGLVQIRDLNIEEENQLLSKKDLDLLQILYNVESTTELEEAYASAVYNTADNEIQLGLGYITRTDTGVEFTFGENENQAIATRSKDLTNNCIPCWNADKKTFAPTNLTISEDGLKINDKKILNEEEVAASVKHLEVQSDWDQTDDTKLDYIKNKPKVLSPTVEISSIENGNKLSITDVNGIHSIDILNGSNGINGTNGQNGITPQLRINSSTNFWEVSYDQGSTWTSLNVKATVDNIKNDTSITIGSSNTVTGTDSIAIGQQNLVESAESIAAGRANQLLGNTTTYNAAFGYNNDITGNANFAANGNNTINSPEGYSATFGDKNTVNAFASFATGQLNTITRQRGFAAGYNNTLTAQDATAFGTSNIASGATTFVGGSGNKAGVQYSFVMGVNNEVYENKESTSGNIGSGAVVFGTNNKASADWQLVTGRWSEETRSALFVVGNGYDENTRSNAFVVYGNGSATVASQGTANNSVVRYDTLNNTIKNAIVNNLTTDDTTKALSAAQGKLLKDKIDELEARVLALETALANKG